MCMEIFKTKWNLICVPHMVVQIVFMCKVGSTGYKGHLQLKHSTAEQHINTTLLFSVYSLQVTELIYDNTVAEHNVESHDTSVTFYSYAHFC